MDLKSILFPDNYTVLFFVAITLGTLYVHFKAFYPGVISSKTKYDNVLSYLFVVFLILFFGLRPIGDNGFTDTPMYLEMFNHSKMYHTILSVKDIGFDILVLFLSYIVNERLFFLICSLLSVGLLYIASKNFAGKNWFLFFLAYCLSLYYFDTNVFTIRQGLAAMFFVLALSQRKVGAQLILIFVSVTFHKSFLLPAAAFVIVNIYNNTRVYLILWMVSIVVSYFSGNHWELLFAKYLAVDSRTDYLTLNDPSLPFFYRSGFRIDMILYSFLIILVGVYYIYVKKFTDKKYMKIFNTFLISNLFVILIIRANVIFRFFYLSWFLLPILVFYPLLYEQIKSKVKYRLISITLSIMCIGILLYKIFKLQSVPF